MLVKFWLHIDKDEQLKRFKEREKISYKQHKITKEDWRNRKKWKQYVVAVNDMLAHTSGDVNPWTVIPANNKRFARAQVLRNLCDTLSEALNSKTSTAVVRDSELKGLTK